MYFEYPKLLWLMIVPALLVLHYVWLELAKKHPHLRVSTAVPWTIKPSYGMAILRHIPFVLRTFALVMIVVAIARPEWVSWCLLEKASHSVLLPPTAQRLST